MGWLILFTVIFYASIVCAVEAVVTRNPFALLSGAIAMFFAAVTFVAWIDRNEPHA